MAPVHRGARRQCGDQGLEPLPAAAKVPHQRLARRQAGGSPVGDHRCRMALLLQQGLQMGHAGRLQLVPAVAMAGHGVVDGGHDLPNTRRDYRHKQRILEVDVVVQRARQDTEGAGDDPHRGACVALGSKQPRGFKPWCSAA